MCIGGNPGIHPHNSIRIMFTILLLQPCGWTDNIGQHGPDDNTWPSIEAAEAAMAELRADGLDAPYRIVDTADLNNYELIA